MTLVELIVCVSLLAALIGLVIPSFSQLLSERRRDSAIRDFTGDLQLARSMALRTSRAVVMCVSSAKRATVHDAIAHNLRVKQVAQQSAESALRYCEAVVFDLVDNDGAAFPADILRVGTVTISSPEHASALWRQPANWTKASANRILAPMVLNEDVRSEAQGVPRPQCIAEPMTNGRYLITARGHSADSTFDANGRLMTGAEVWLQSVLSPQIPVQSAGGGHA